MNKPILITGRNGQVGRSLVKMLGEQAVSTSRTFVNLMDTNFIVRIEEHIKDQPIGAVINTAAYNKVDMAEGEGSKDAFRVNAEAVRELAVWCRQRGIPLIHYSTDYVMAGTGDKPHTENETPAPQNTYGKSKLAGEQVIQETGGDYLILRTSWVYDHQGHNFVNTIRRLIAERDTLKVVNDQIGAPTYAPHLAKATLDILNVATQMPEFPSGVYHLCNAGEVSWFDFAQAIFMLARDYESEIKCQKIQPIPSAEYPTPARRPLNSRLDMTKVQKVLGIHMPDWRQGLQECFESIHGSDNLQSNWIKDHTA